MSFPPWQRLHCITDATNREALHTESICSTITCLFAVLRKSTARDVLEQAMAVVEKTHALGSNAVELSLYDGARNMITEYDKYDNDHSERDSSANSVDTVGAAAGPNAIGTRLGKETSERFLSELVLALFGSAPQLSHASQISNTENVRLARIKTASTMLQSTSVLVSSQDILKQMLESWLRQEHSQALRLLIKEALRGKVSAETT